VESPVGMQGGPNAQQAAICMMRKVTDMARQHTCCAPPRAASRPSQRLPPHSVPYRSARASGRGALAQQRRKPASSLHALGAPSCHFSNFEDFVPSCACSNKYPQNELVWELQLVSVGKREPWTEPSSSKVANFNNAQWFQLFVPHFAQGHEPNQPPPEFH